MSSTEFSAGLPSKLRNSSKVLKPPGGGSSDIFGRDAPTTPRLIKNHMKSNIFGAPENMSFICDKPRRAQTFDSYNRLFGEINKPITSAKNYMRSNIPFGSDTADGINKKHSTNGKRRPVDEEYGQKEGKVKPIANGNGFTSNGSSDAGINKNSNPVEGHSYKKKSSNGDASSFSASTNSGHVINKNRIPPGGFSSGLW